MNIHHCPPPEGVKRLYTLNTRGMKRDIETWLIEAGATEAWVYDDEESGLRLLSYVKFCRHPRATIYTRLAAAATRYLPAEHVSRAHGAWLDPDDLPEDCERLDEHGRTL